MVEYKTIRIEGYLKSSAGHNELESTKDVIVEAIGENPDNTYDIQFITLDKDVNIDSGHEDYADYRFQQLRDLIRHCARESKQWWEDLETGEPKDRNIGEVLCLIHSEISEAMEGYRKNLMDDKLPHRKMIEVELADAVIRIFDLAGQKGYDLAGAMREKMEYNRHREDHKRENRLKENGKKF